MNAHEKFVAAHAHVDEAAIQPLPNSRKIYVEGSRPDIRVPMREISQDDTPTACSAARRTRRSTFTTAPAPIPTRRPRSTSAPACRPCAQSWIAERGDTEALATCPRNSAASAPPTIARRAAFPRPAPQAAAAPKPASQRHADALRAQGIITPEMEYIAIRENNNRRAYIES
jgi:phosphomethylpyrimidine synthase